MKIIGNTVDKGFFAEDRDKLLQFCINVEPNSVNDECFIRFFGNIVSGVPAIKAWEHHKEKNAHHWQSRVGKEFNNYMGFERDYYAIENAMDWIAMAYAFNENPINTYYLKNKDKMQLSENDIYVIETVFEIMMDNELLGE